MALVIAEIGFVAVLFLAQQRGAENAPDQVAVAPQTEALAPAPDLRGSIAPTQPAATDHSDEAPARPVLDPQPANEEPADAPAASSITGALPAPGSDLTGDPAAPSFAVYLNEFAPDQAGALALAIGAQRRFGAALGGARFSYKRVRPADKDVWRLRVAGLSRERANQICQAVAEMGGVCEVGPK